ncbi:MULTISPECIES: Bug family tripartite tricarboxylate transporter substrate binding protein [Cupriavidus]|uniref:Tripartite tricarboxylate transporter substrate binding protein n=1 Tax=Cupriavidus pauculus TaxID=82633 RepID=A0A5P2HAC8_9BURK|nr:tripartite tricarboxylate transporter substrate binding protein [Cupriavidus pauculus]QET05177.1 tripartite tricarboxylate transporter substrate binding protein [Cupriavidus pauculus]
MSNQRRSFLRAMAAFGVGAGGSAVLPRMAWAEKAVEYPTGPVNVVIPFTAGGSTDYMGRMIMTDVGTRFGGKFIPENKPGASGSIGTSGVLRAQPDGHSLLYTTAAFLTNLLLYKNLPYDPIADFTPIARTVGLPLVLIVGKQTGVTSVPGLIDYLKRNQQAASYGSYGIGTSSHVSASIFLKKVGLSSIVHVPYKDNRITSDLVEGRLTFMLEAWSVAAPMVQAGRAVALAVTSDQPLPFSPQLPTIQSAIREKYNLVSWHAVFARKKTPEDILDLLNKEINVSLAKERIQKATNDMGFLKYPPLTRPALTSFLADELPRWKALMTEAGVQMI